MSKKIWQLLDARTFSGIEKHVEVINEALLGEGYDATIMLLTPFSPHPLLERFTAKGAKFHVLKGGYAGLKQAVSEFKPDLIHTHGYKGGILGRIVGSLNKTPVVSTYHAGERGKFPVSLYQAIDENLSFLAKANFAVSPQIQARVKNSIVLKNFIPVKPLTRVEYPNVIAFVGRLSHEKAPDLFLETARICQDLPLKFVVYGDGDMRADLEKSAPSNIIFKGFTSTMEDEWTNIGALLMPSRAEGLPMAALEAMAAGIPVIASKVGALPTLISENNGFLFDIGDTKTATNHINTWFHGDKQARAKAAYETVSQNYNAAVEIKNLTKTYQLLLS